MGRIRTIKPEWLDDEQMVLTSDAGRVLSVALICLADDYGRGRLVEPVMSARIFPRNPGIFRDAFAELQRSGFVASYRVGKETFWHICKWSSHQRVDKPGKSLIPAPLDGSQEIPGNFSENSHADLGPRTMDLGPRTTSSLPGTSQAPVPVVVKQSKAPKEPKLGHLLRLDYETGWEALMKQPYLAWSAKHGTNASRVASSPNAYSEAKELLSDFFASKHPQIIASGYSFCSGPWSFVMQLDALRAQRAQPNLRRAARAVDAMERQVSNEDAEKVKFEQDMARLRRQDDERERNASLGGAISKPAVGALNAFSGGGL